MSSENILQNSPALHSLKRTQLVRLCRNHGLKFKATEKNTDLIQRLQEYGRNPPRPSGSDDESEDEGPAMDADPQPAPRPSEAWSLVDEPSVDFSPRFSSTLPTIKEFGGSDSIKSSSVSSSFKALANSLFHTGSSSSKTKVSDPVEPSIPTQNESENDAPSEYSMDPDPELNTSISTIYRQDPGASTVRLVSTSQNRRSSSPEYANPSPFRGKSIIAVPSPCPTESLYPRIPSPFTPPHFGTPETGSGSDISRLPGAFPPPPPFRFPEYAGSSSGMSPEFTFRSPIPSSSGGAASAKDTILEEMNRRMQLTSGDNGAVGLDSLLSDTRTKKRSREEDEDEEQSLIKSDPLSKVRFEKLHQKQFDKMPSITDHYAARRGSPRKSSMSSVTRTSMGRRGRNSRPSVPSAAQRRSSARPRPSLLKQAHVPVKGDDDERRRAAKRTRTSEAGPSDSHAPVPVLQIADFQVQISATTAPDAGKDVVTLTADAKRKVDKAKARRKSRSSMARQSMGRNTVLGSSKAKGFGSRFGFLKTSAKLVRSVYTAVVGGEQHQVPADGKKSNDTTTPLSVPVAAAKKTSGPPTSIQAEKKPIRPSSSSVPMKSPPSDRRNAGNSKAGKRDATSSGQLAAPLTTQIGHNNPGRGGSTSSRDTKISIPGATSRLPVPGWSASKQGKSVTSTSSSRISRGSSLLSSMNTASRSDAPSSLGSSSTPVSSLGLRRPTTGSGGTTMTSTLYAPTVSSLARMRPPSIVSSSKGRQSHVKGSLSRMAEPLKPPADAHTYVTVSPSLQGTPNKFGFRGVASPTTTSASLKATFSRFALPPQFQMTNGVGAVTSPTGRSSGMTPSNRVSLAAAGASKGPVVQPFSFSRTDFGNVISPTAEAKTAVLDAMENMDTMSRAIHVDRQAVKASAPLLPRTPSTSAPHRRPRISRSKVIAKLGEKRAAAAASSGADRQSDIGVVDAIRPTIEMPRRPKVRSSLHTRTRRSIAAPGSSGKERAILESYHRGQRKSEAAVRRQSRFRAVARISSPTRNTDRVV